MSTKCLLLVGSEIPRTAKSGSGVPEPKGAARGLVPMRGLNDADSAVKRAEQGLIASALELGANVVINCRYVELRNTGCESLVYVGDAWYVPHLDTSGNKPVVGYGVNNVPSRGK